jgi:PAS domain S-box-containing protein
MTAVPGQGAGQAPAPSEGRFRALVENSPDGIALLSGEGRVLYGSPSLARLLGYPPNALPGRNAFELVHPDDLPAKLALAGQLLAEPGGHTCQRLRLRHLDGSWRWVEVQETNLLHDPAVGSVVANFRDVTEQRRAEEERLRFERRVMEAQRLEGLGLLAGGVAHCFNNLLTAVLGYADLVGMGLPPGSPLRAYLAQIELAARRAAELCQQLVAYAGKGRFAVEPVALSDLVRDSAALLRPSLPNKVALEVRLAPDLPPVQADATQLGHVVMSLVLNAAEAVGNREGRITVSTGRTAVGPAGPGPDYRGAELAPGEYVTLEVSDTGCGMDEAMRARIFEPFFTTKFTGRGLGLSAVLGIVRGHKGGLCVESKPGAGTTFRLLFPAGST